MKTYTASEARQLRKEIENRDKPKRGKAKIQKSEHSKALDRADKFFSLWFRANEADEQGIVRCCTCGTYKRWKERDGSTQTGHWQSRGFAATRFDVRNVGVQCYKCNCKNEGLKSLHEAWLVKKFGVDEVENVRRLAALPNKRLSDFELDEIARFYKAEYGKVVKQKGL